MEGLERTRARTLLCDARKMYAPRFSSTLALEAAACSTPNCPRLNTSFGHLVPPLLLSCAPHLVAAAPSTGEWRIDIVPTSYEVRNAVAVRRRQETRIARRTLRGGGRRANLPRVDKDRAHLLLFLGSSARNDLPPALLSTLHRGHPCALTLDMSGPRRRHAETRSMPLNPAVAGELAPL
jgi:hypothetical protein